jgi:diguanylate cyclase
VTDGDTPQPARRELEIEQAQLRGFARSFAEVEWLLLLLVMLYLFITRPELAQEPLVIGLLIAFAVFVCAFRYGNLLATRTRAKIATEIVVMVAFLTGILAVAGAALSALVNLYLLPIITAALALGKRATVGVLILVCVCYVMLLVVAADDAGFAATLRAQSVGVLAPFVLVAFLASLLADNMHTARERIRELADRDELTSLYNLRAFTRLARHEHELAARSGLPYALLLVDVDRLKAINDEHGHEAGNRALQLVADALRRLTRTADVTGRLAGDEFVLMLRNADREVAEDVAQRIRNVVFATTLEHESRIVRVQVSVGVSVYPDDGRTFEQALSAADRAVHEDKKGPSRPPGRLIIHRR